MVTLLETKPNCHSRVWQVEDVRYLVEMVWASRSVLHGSGDLYDLVLVRWDRWREWSPWNCILLSKNEAKAHTELEDINKVSLQTGSCIVGIICCRPAEVQGREHERSQEVTTDWPVETHTKKRAWTSSGNPTAVQIQKTLIAEKNLDVQIVANA